MSATKELSWTNAEDVPHLTNEELIEGLRFLRRSLEETGHLPHRLAMLDEAITRIGRGA